MILGARTLVILLWGYVASSRYYLLGSLQFGDLIALGCFALLLVSAADERAILDFFSGAYGWIAGAASILVLAVALFHTTPLPDLAFAAQFAYTLWIVVPLVALSVAFARDPLRTLERAAWIFLLAYFIGAVLLFGFGRDWVLYLSGIGRVFSHYTYYVFQQVAVCIAVVQLIRARARPWRYILLLVLAAMPVLLHASRTGIVILAFLSLAAVLGNIRALRGFVVATVATGVLIGVLTSTALQQSLGVRVLTANAIFQDAERVNAITRTVERLQDQPQALLWGLGWGNSGDGLVVHNLFIQLTAEGGVLACVLIIILLAIPWLWVARRLLSLNAEALVAGLLTLVIWLNWLLNAFPVERVHWLSFGVALGLAYRVRTATAEQPVVRAVPVLT